MSYRLLTYVSDTGPRPGDVIATGTCAGIGRPRGLFLENGDEVAVTIGNLGTLRTPIIRDNVP